jgi:hypothetical protein
MRTYLELVRPGGPPPGLQEYLTRQLLAPKPFGAPI